MNTSCCKGIFDDRSVSSPYNMHKTILISPNKINYIPMKLNIVKEGPYQDLETGCPKLAIAKFLGVLQP